MREFVKWKKDIYKNSVTSLASEFKVTGPQMMKLFVYSMIIATKNNRIAMKTIGNLVGMQVSSIKRVRDSLIEDGYIEVLEKGKQYATYSCSSKYKICKESGNSFFEWNIFMDVDKQGCATARALGYYFYMRSSFLRMDKNKNVNWGGSFYETEVNKDNAKFLEFLEENGLIKILNKKKRKVTVIFILEKMYNEEV